MLLSGIAREIGDEVGVEACFEGTSEIQRLVIAWAISGRSAGDQWAISGRYIR